MDSQLVDFRKQSTKPLAVFVTSNPGFNIKLSFIFGEPYRDMLPGEEADIGSKAL